MWDPFLDLVLGGRCVACARPGRSLCPACRASLPDDARRRVPEPCPPGLAPCFAAGDYDQALQAMVLAHKEHAVLSLRRPLGDLLAQSVRAAVPDADWPVLLVPVGSRRGSARRRGHDPLLGIVRAAAATLRLRRYDAAPARLLVSRSGVRDQAGLSAEERHLNLAGSQQVAAGRLHRVRGLRARVVLCDDVLTTGATVRDAQRALEALGVRVEGVAVVAATVRRNHLSSHREVSAPRLSRDGHTH